MLKGILSYATTQGPRPHQEDRYFFETVPPSLPTGFLMAVMDGHGGSETANVCEKEIGPAFSSVFNQALDPKILLRSLVSILVDKTSALRSGSTLSVAWVMEDREEVAVAVLGDSPIIVIDKQGKINLSPDHNVRTNAIERKRAVERGAYYDGRYIYNRSGRGLEMSRALGDIGLNNILSRDPEIYTVNEPLWVIIGSDGIFDPEHESLIAFAEKLVRQLQMGSSATNVMQWVKSRGLEDNATVLIWKSGIVPGI